MNATLDAISQALTKLSQDVEKRGTAYNTQTFKEKHGWNHPAVTTQDLYMRPKQLADAIRQANIDTLEPDLEKQLSAVATRLISLTSDTTTYIFNGNATAAIPVYIITLESLEKLLEPVLYNWETIADTKALPPALTRRLRGVRLAIDRIENDAGSIEDKIKIISNAHDAAESLPVDMESLREARIKIEETSQRAESLFAKLSVQAEDISTKHNTIQTLEDNCQKLVSQCEEAYRITTTKGLAASFHQSSNRLQITLWVWVAGLLIALGIGAYLGHNRLELLSTELKKDYIEWNGIWMQAILSIVSLGAPIWFAWLATKQIGQRFRLSEDYAFKASVAKAYEGYRKEAARIDPRFEAQLFESALTRLDEAPLRLVETDAHGSPFHEFFNSDAFRQALDKIPGFQSAYNKSLKKKQVSNQSMDKESVNNESKVDT